jgi:hypothetical protein
MNKIIYLLLFIANVANAQLAVPFWSEDFTNGLPATWTTTDQSNQNKLWTWCANPSDDDTAPGCPPIWNDGTNGQVPFASTSAATGFVTADSDEFGELPQDHISQLTTSAINCSGKNAVYVKFESLLGTYTYDADDKAILKVSTDKINWTNFQVFSGLTRSVRWSNNPEIAIIDITSVAANKPTIYLQWEWTGNFEYMWNLDDVKVYGENPTPKHDLQLSGGFYPASSYATPASEIKTDTFGFFAFVSNNGLSDQKNVKLKAWITNSTGTIFFADSTNINTLPAGYQDSVIELSKLYAPELPIGLYNINYAVSADSADARISDNLKVSVFEVTSAVFAKEDGPEQYYRPASIPNQTSWTVCNYYRFSKSSVEQYKAVSASFAYTTTASDIEVKDVVAPLYLLRVNDDITDDLVNLDGTSLFSSLEFIGTGDFDAPDSINTGGSIQFVQLVDANGSDGVALEKGGRYILAIEYSGDNRLAFHAFNDDNSVLFRSTLIYNNNEFSSFGDDVNAVLRLQLALVSTTDNVALPSYAMEIFPNPATDFVTINVNLDKSSPVTVTIADITGKVIVSDDQTNTQQASFTYPLPKLAAGIYLARIATNEGTLTKRFVVK